MTRKILYSVEKYINCQNAEQVSEHALYYTEIPERGGAAAAAPPELIDTREAARS